MLIFFSTISYLEAIKTVLIDKIFVYVALSATVGLAVWLVGWLWCKVFRLYLDLFKLHGLFVLFMIREYRTGPIKYGIVVYTFVVITVAIYTVLVLFILLGVIK